MLTETLILALLGFLGVTAYRDTMAWRTSDAAFWRKGLVILCRALPARVSPAELPEPKIPPSLFGWRPKIHRIAPLEVAFTAQSSNSPLMKGLLSFDETTRSVVVTGRVFWGIMPLFVAMGGIVLWLEPKVGVWLCLGIAGFIGVEYWSERRRFLNALASVASRLSGE